MFPTPDRQLTAAVPRLGRCFRTAADGRIALTQDWIALLRETHRAGRCVLQTRHASAYLVACAALPELSLQRGSASAVAHDQTAVWDFRFGSWGQAAGFLRSCECCASPGRVEIHNRLGGEFFRACALSGSDPHDWSDYLAAIAAPGQTPPAIPASDAVPARFELPRLARAHVRLPFHLEALGALLSAFGDEGLAVRCTLRTADLIHQRDLVPRQVVEHGGMLNAGEPGARVQLAWPAAQGFALTSDAGGWALHVVGADDVLLLTFSAALDPTASITWSGALRAAFPGLR